MNDIMVKNVVLGENGINLVKQILTQNHMVFQ